MPFFLPSASMTNWVRVIAMIYPPLPSRPDVSRAELRSTSPSLGDNAALAIRHEPANDPSSPAAMERSGIAVKCSALLGGMMSALSHRLR